MAAATPPETGMVTRTQPAEIPDPPKGPRHVIVTPHDFVEGQDDGVLLPGKTTYTCSWVPKTTPVRAAVVLLHGLHEYCHRFLHVIDYMLQAGIAVYSGDFLGHGKSEGTKGYCTNINTEFVDVAVRRVHRVAQQISASTPPVPLFLYGHSMGGAIASAVVRKLEPGLLRGAIFSSPLAKPANIGWLTYIMGHIASTIYPSLQVTPLDKTALSHYTSVQDEYVSDPLIPQSVMAIMGMQLMELGQNVWDTADQIQVPLLIVYGDADAICPPEGSRNLYNKSKSTDKTLIVYQGGCHELHNDYVWQVEVADIVTWITHRLWACRAVSRMCQCWWVMSYILLFLKGQIWLTLWGIKTPAMWLCLIPSLACCTILVVSSILYVGVPQLASSSVEQQPSTSDEPIPLTEIRTTTQETTTVLSTSISPTASDSMQTSLISKEDVELGESTEPTVSEEKASLLSRLFFSWVRAILLEAQKHPLSENDLYPLSESDKCPKLCHKFDLHLSARPTELQLAKALILTEKKNIFLTAVFRLAGDGLLLCGPILLQKLVLFLEVGEEPFIVGLMYAAGLVATNLLSAFLQQWHLFVGLRTGMRVRSILVGTVYRKCFTIKNFALFSPGQVVNLQAIDAEKVQQLCTVAHTLWSTPVIIVLGITLMVKFIGWAPSLCGIAIMVISVPVHAVLISRLNKIQKDTMTFKDQRSKILSEAFRGIQTLKLFAWESHIEEKVQNVRQQELNIVRKNLVLQAIASFIFGSTPVLVAIAIFFCFTFMGGVLTPEIAFPVISLVNILRMPLNVFPTAITGLVEAHVSLRRVSGFLSAAESETEAAPKTRDSCDGCSIEISNATFAWTEEHPTLSDINLKVNSGQLVAVIGPVASGKSSLISAILSAMPRLSGEVSVCGSIGYVSQSAWIQNATVKDNILFGKEYDESRYNAVLSACALNMDLESMPNGEMTEIGERGINLSGGQKQRVALARAVYHDCDIYLLDDPLSSVDVHVASILFHECIKGLLREKTVLLVTHQVQYLTEVDNIFVLQDGHIRICGSYAQLLEAGLDFSACVTPNLKPTPQTSVKTGRGGGKGGDIITPEALGTGAISWRIYKAYLLAAGSVFISIVIVILFMSDAILRSATDIWLGVWSAMKLGDRNSLFYPGIYGLLGMICLLSKFAHDLGIGIAGLRVAIKLHGRMLHSVLVSPMSFFYKTPVGRLMNRFTRDINNADTVLPRTLGMLLTMVFGLCGIIVVISIGTPYFLVSLAPIFALYIFIRQQFISASRDLNRLDAVSKSPIFNFLEETVNGIVTIKSFGIDNIQRFNEINLQKVEKNMKASFLSNAANRWLGVRLEFISSFLMIVTVGLALVQQNSLPTLAALSITYSLNTTAMLTWLIRVSSEVEVLFVSAERILEYIGLTPEPGACIPSSRGTTEITWPHHEIVPDLIDTWPGDGSVNFHNLSVRYRDNLDLVLSNVSIDIKHGEKIGICGRTGAGKSSLILALFRIIEPLEGSICISHTDIINIPVTTLRSRMSIIPQDPQLFSGTLRDCLDPWHEYTDEVLWAALRSVRFDNFVKDLSACVEEHGTNFSMGQRQLICLARAILARSKILVLDEATAAVDLELDSLIQEAIRHEFPATTVITIAHRVNTIIDYDRILVLEHGRVAEYDTPTNLLARPSIFSTMVHSTATHTSVTPPPLTTPKED
ncbi:multidrug resistance-associated protein 3 [Pelomyxa schiedti]|nr:multidrug resistance-associated protein 3 [Pelomyxa schiedti]